MRTISLILLPLICCLFYGCGEKKNKEQNPLKKSLLFYASFDKGIGADYANGDPLLYDSPNRKAVDTVSNDLSYAAIKHKKGGGVSGGALSFYDKTRAVAYFKSQENLNFKEGNWQGTISFWLKLNPDEDLKPGYCDPIQITDVRYNDASIWVDFTKDLPRQFRLGVFGDLKHWNPNNISSDSIPSYEDRLVRVDAPPFNREKWTHIAITHEFLGDTSGKGIATLYINGKPQGGIKQSDPFSWDIEKSNIYLGLSYIGLLDELTVFDRPLNNQEINELTNIKNMKSKLSL